MNEQFLRHRQIGNQFFGVGSYKRAAREYESALGLEPDDAFVRLRLARCWIQLNQQAKARREVEIALEYYPNDPDAHYVMSYAAHLTKTALKSIDTALALRPDKATYWERRGYLLTQLQQFSKAIEALNKALELAPDAASGHRQMADTLFAEADSSSILTGTKGLSPAKREQAAFHVKRALELQPEQSRSHSLEARLKTFDLEYEASYEKWQEALRLNPTDQHAQKQLRKAKNQAEVARIQELVWRALYRKMPWPLRLPLTWGLMGASFCWSVSYPIKTWFLNGIPVLFLIVFPCGAFVTPLLLRDWLQFVPDRFLDATLLALKKPPLR